MAQIIHLDPPRDAPAQMPVAPPTDESAMLPQDRGRTDAALTDDAQNEGARTELVPLRPERLRSDARSATRLTGEAASERFILFMPQDPGEAELLLTHRTGIESLSTRSSLGEFVNGTALGQIEPDNFSGFASDSLEIPAGVLRAGRNLVEIRARHTHRIACGPDASFALWTDIDAENSGVRIAADMFGDGPICFMAAIAAQAGRGMPVTFLRPDPDLPMLDAAPFIAQAAIALGGTPPDIVSAPYWRMEDDTPQLARITAFPTGEGPSRPRFLRGGDGALVLFVDLAQDYSPVMAELLSQDDMGRKIGPAPLTPGRAQPFSGLGIDRMQGQGRYLTLSVEFALPWDWVLLASQKARLDLDYQFAAGLPEGAVLLVKVNGTTVRLLPLDNAGGQAIPTLPISFGARVLQPGVNRLEFEALIPGDPPDMACPPMDGPMLEISPRSQLFVPASPRMSLPSIDLTLAMIPANEIVLSPSAERQLSPSLAPQIAAALLAGQTQPTPEGPVPHFNIGTVSDIERFQTPMLRDSVRQLYAVLGPNVGQDGKEQSVAAAWDAVEGARGLFSWRNLDEVAQMPRKLVNMLEGLVYGTNPSLNAWLDGRAAQAAIVQPDLDEPGEIWLIFSPHVDPSTVVRALAASATSRDRPMGQVSLYREGRGWESWTAPNRPLTLHEGVGAGNLRAVMGNYATLLPLPFVAVLLGLALFSALVAFVILILTRRRGQ